MIKRSLIISIILLIIIFKISLEQKITQTLQLSQVFTVEKITDEQIACRDLEQPRQTEIEKVTTYSQECIDFVKSKESFKSKAYKPVSTEKYWTIGYGHYGADVKEGQTITEEEAYRLMIAELNGCSEYVAKKCSYLNLTQSQFDALVSFTYNGGPGMLNQLTNNGKRNMEEVKEHITAYTNHGLKGLVTRRAEELEMLNN